MASAEARRVWEGRVVAGKFPLRQWLGGSDHSSVFLTELEEKGSPTLRKAAIKLIPADRGDAGRQLSQLRSAAQLSHPHLIRILEAGRCEFDGAPFVYVVMEYAEEDLAQILPERPLTPDEVGDLLPPLLDALSYLHGKGFVHRRVRPSNVLAAGDQLKLSGDQASAPAQSHAPQRTDVYDAPELATGVISPAGDIWSLGVTVVAALTQKTPAMGEAQATGLLETLTEPFRGIARECLQVDPKRRCSIAQIQARLQPAARSVPAAREPAPTPVRHYRYTWRMLIPIAILLAFGLGGYLFHLIFASKPPASGYNIQIAPETSQGQGSSVASPAAGANTKGTVVRQVLPDIPQSAQDTITGTIKINVRVEVDPSGKVTAAKFVTRGPSQYFAERTLKAGQSWEFSPPAVNGQLTASVWLLHFRLRRNSIQAAAEQLRR